MLWLPPLPLPDLNLEFYETAAQWARDIIAVVDANGILWIIVALGMAGFALAWVIELVKKPPRI